VIPDERQDGAAYYEIAEPHLANILHCVEQRFMRPPGVFLEQ
jgi:hypothetical protein